MPESRWASAMLLALGLSFVSPADGLARSTDDSRYRAPAESPVSAQWGDVQCSEDRSGNLRVSSYACIVDGNVAASSACRGLTRPSTDLCTASGGASYSWSVGGWSSCSASCGTGTQTRAVTCRSSIGTTVADAQCTAAKPAAFQTCSNTSGCPTTDTTAPSVPTITRAVASACDSVELAWRQSTDPAPGSGISGYNVRRSRDGGTWTTAAQLPPTALALVDGALGGGSQYSYEVEAVDGASPANRSVSPRVSVSTPSCTTAGLAPGGALAGIDGDEIVVDGARNVGLVASVYTGVKVIDVANDLAPRRIGTFDIRTLNVALLPGGRAYLTEPGFLVLVEYSPTVRVVARIPISGGLGAMIADGSTLYLAGTEGGAPTLRILDITNPAAPITRGSARLGAQPTELAVSGGVVYAASASELGLIDARQPTAPRVSSLGNWGSNLRLDVVGGRLYQADPGRLTVFGIANPLNRTVLFSGFYKSNAVAHLGSRSVLAYDWDLMLFDMDALLPLGNIGHDLVPPVASLNLGWNGSSRVTIRAMAAGSRSDVVYATDSTNAFRVIRVGP